MKTCRVFQIVFILSTLSLTPFMVWAEAEDNTVLIATSSKDQAMTVDPQTQAILDQGKGGPQLHELTVAEARSALREMTFKLDIEKTDVHKRVERTIPGPNGDIPVRIYWPAALSGNETLPILVLYHGGGFALGDMDTHENVSRYYAKNGNVIVINVHYRLSPENPFPAGVEDAYAAVAWAAENAGSLGGDKSRIAITGDSAGGNISAVVAQLARERGGPSIAYQLLVYPSVTLRPNSNYASHETYGNGDYFLSRDSLTWLRGMYFEDSEDSKSVLASPILAKDLSGLPPALIITAGYDILRDEGKHYADRLREAGVPVEYKCFETTIHGFMSFAGGIDAGRQGLDLVVKTLKEKLHK